MDLPSDQFPCLGLEWLGQCSYDPSKPFAVYFGIGDAVAALALILAVQQILKPVYRFRLRAYNLKIWHFLVPVFFGFACVMVAALLPNLPIQRRSFWSYPISWELIGGMCMLFSYAALATVTMAPARLFGFNLLPFVRASIELLSSAGEEDQARFAHDLFTGRNIEKLIKWTLAFDRAETHAAHMEFARLRQIGAPTVIHGRAQVSGFYLFAHRRELVMATHAATLLDVIADEHFCATLVRRCGLLVAAALQSVSRKYLHSQQADSFVREIARQAILKDDSIVAREAGYHGFARVPALSENLFSDPFIVGSFNPFDFTIFLGARPSPTQVERFTDAAERCFKTLITETEGSSPQAIHSIKHIFEFVFMDCRRIQADKAESDALPGAVHHAVDMAVKMADMLEGRLFGRRYQGLYLPKVDLYLGDLLGCLVEIVFDAVCGFANDFLAGNDPFWLTAITMFQHVFPQHGTYPDGMTPFQQRLAMKLVDKLQDNMDGYYPAISRVLLACLGPYKPGADRTAFGILREAVYAELQRLPALAASAPDKVAHFLPEFVTFDQATGNLIHTYRGGQQDMTNLLTVNIPPVSLAPDDVAAVIPIRGSD